MRIYGTMRAFIEVNMLDKALNGPTHTIQQGQLRLQTIVDF